MKSIKEALNFLGGMAALYAIAFAFVLLVQVLR